MNKLLKRALFMTVVLCLVITAALTVSAAPTTYSQESNSGTRDELCTSLSGTSASEYYTGTYTYDNLSALSESALLSSLRKLMTDTHDNITSYDDCKDYAPYTDCENEDGRVLLIYTSYSATMDQWNGWNREHVWPQSLGGGNTSGGGADLHHIRPSDAGVNSSRGNKKYGEIGSDASSKYGTNPATGYLGGYYNDTYFEPLDNVKGDVARICLYVYVRWGSGWGADSITEVFQSVDVLLDWCALDPVDTWEMGRNEVVYGIQGNRNVFIDYPELAWIMLGEEVPENMSTPSGNANGGAGTCNHANTSLVNKIDATCTENGYTGDLKCQDCKQIITKGSVITCAGHSYGDPVTTKEPTETETGTAVKTCSKCGDEIIIIISATGKVLPIEIVSNNVYYKDTLNLMYAVRTTEDYDVAIKIYDSDNKLVETIKTYKTENVKGEMLKTFTSSVGVPVQNIDTEFFAVAELLDGENVVDSSPMKRYSVLEYIYERLTVSVGVTEAQVTMYERLLKYANSTDVVVNNPSEEESILNYSYVNVNGGTVDGVYSTAMLKAGISLDVLATDYETEAGKTLAWSIVTYDFINNPSAVIIKNDVIGDFVIEAGKSYLVTPVSVGADAPSVQTVTVSKTAKEITALADVSTAGNGGSLNGKTVPLDENISIICNKGSSTAEPAYYDESIRLYQGGATLTVKATGGAKIKTIIITLENNTSGDGPIKVEGGVADNPNAPTDYVYTITANDGVTEVVITTTGTDKNSRVYVANIEVIYEE